MKYETALSIPTVKLRYFAYNCIEMKLPGGKTLVIDPCLKKEGRFSCGYDENDLEGCDYVLINHTHMDHVETLGKVYERFHPLIMAHSAVAYDLAKFYDIPYIRMAPFVEGQTFDYGCFKVETLRARHNSSAMFMIRPSGRIDETANDKLTTPAFAVSSGAEQRLFDKGTLYNSNFLITLPNNLRIGIFAGTPGMLEPEDTALWKRLRPDIIFAHRAKITYPDYAGQVANVLAVTGAQVMIPIHFEGAYTGEFDAGEYIANVNRACEARGISGRAIFLEKAKWYQFSTGVQQCE